ncbi:MAG: 50S ribosomal protein L15 [Chlamydiales bacterium]
MITLSNLSDTHRPRKKSRRVGRGMGSKRGKTCGRGSKGDKARCGYRQNYGREGGRTPLYRKLPARGFPNARFQPETAIIDFDLINAYYKDGEVVNAASLHEKGLVSRRALKQIKMLSNGELSKKKVSIEAHHFSKAAVEKLEKLSISYKKLTAQAE